VYRKGNHKGKPIIDASVQSVRSFYLGIFCDNAIEFNVPTDGDSCLDIARKSKAGFMPSYVISDGNGRKLVVSSGLKKTETSKEDGKFILH